MVSKLQQMGAKLRANIYPFKRFTALDCVVLLEAL